MITPLPPDSICGYTILRSPSPGTYIALADGGREVLLKPLDADCLLHGQLHPSIKERLARVRELALKSAANLHGVERDGRGVFLIWEFIPGESLESAAAKMSPTQLIAMMREVVLSVEALHQVGIVHGALHACNVIIDTAGRPRLTHISPLLFDDPLVDEAAAQTMLNDLTQPRTDIDSSIRNAVAERRSFRELSSMLMAASVAPTQSQGEDDPERGRRKRMLLVALAVALVGVAIAITIAMVAGARR
jgi:serine/threonine protein kinase